MAAFATGAPCLSHSDIEQSPGESQMSVVMEEQVIVPLDVMSPLGITTHWLPLGLCIDSLQNGALCRAGVKEGNVITAINSHQIRTTAGSELDDDRRTALLQEYILSLSTSTWQSGRCLNLRLTVVDCAGSAVLSSRAVHDMDRTQHGSNTIPFALPGSSDLSARGSSAGELSLDESHETLPGSAGDSTDVDGSVASKEPSMSVLTRAIWSSQAGPRPSVQIALAGSLLLGVLPAVVISLVNVDMRRQLDVHAQATVTALCTALPLLILSVGLAGGAYDAAPGDEERKAEMLKMVQGDAKQLKHKRCFGLVSGAAVRNYYGSLAWLSYAWDWFCLSTFAFLPPVPWGAQGTLAGWQNYLSVVILDLSPLGDGVTQACFIVVACLFGLMALSVLLRPMEDKPAVHDEEEEDKPAVHPAFSGLNKLLLQLGFIPALRLALTMTRCQYTDETVPVAMDVYPAAYVAADNISVVTDASGTSRCVCYGPAHLAFAGAGMVTAILLLVFNLYFGLHVNNVCNPAHRFLEKWLVLLTVVKASVTAASVFLSTVSEVFLVACLLMLVAAAVLNWYLQPHLSDHTWVNNTRTATLFGCAWSYFCGLLAVSQRGGLNLLPVAVMVYLSTILVVMALAGWINRYRAIAGGHMLKHSVYQNLLWWYSYNLTLKLDVDDLDEEEKEDQKFVEETKNAFRELDTENASSVQRVHASLKVNRRGVSIKNLVSALRELESGGSYFVPELELFQSEAAELLQLYDECMHKLNALELRTKAEEDARTVLCMKKIPLFKDCDSAFVSMVTSKMSREEPLSGTIICTLGEVGDRCWVLERGEIKLVDGEGQESKNLTATIDKTPIFGELALLDNAQRTFTIIAKTDCELSVLSRERLKECFSTHPGAESAVLSALDTKYADRSAHRVTMNLNMVAHLRIFAKHNIRKSWHDRRGSSFQSLEDLEDIEKFKAPAARVWAEMLVGIVALVFMSFSFFLPEEAKKEAWYTVHQACVLQLAIVAIACVFMYNTELSIIRYWLRKSACWQIISLIMFDWVRNLVSTGEGFQFVDRLSSTVLMVFRFAFVFHDGLCAVSRFSRVSLTIMFFLGNVLPLYHALVIDVPREIYRNEETNASVTTSSLKLSASMGFLSVTVQSLRAVIVDKDFLYFSLCRSFLPKDFVDFENDKSQTEYEKQQQAEKRHHAWTSRPSCRELAAMTLSAIGVLTLTLGDPEIYETAAIFLLIFLALLGVYFRNFSLTRVIFVLKSPRALFMIFFVGVYGFVGFRYTNPNARHPASPIIDVGFTCVAFLFWLGLEAVVEVSRWFRFIVTLICVSGLFASLWLSLRVWTYDPVVFGTMSKLDLWRVCFTNLAFLMSGSLMTIISDWEYGDMMCVASGYILKEQIILQRDTVVKQGRILGAKITSSLSRIQLFKGCDTEFVAMLASKMKSLKTVKRETTICEVGEVGDRCWALKRGEIKVVDSEGQVFQGESRFSLSPTIEETPIFGELALLDKVPRKFTIIAKTDCELSVLTSKSLEKCFLIHPKAERAVREQLEILYPDRHAKAPKARKSRRISTHQQAPAESV